MTGGLVSEMCDQSDTITEVILLNRREGSKQRSNKFKEVVMSDFDEITGDESWTKDIDIVFFCLGVYTGAVDRDTFRRITVGYTRNIAAGVKKHSARTTFCFLSGQGADPTEKSRLMFAQDKGVAENMLMGLDFEGLNIFRPAYIYPVNKRQEPNWSYGLMRRLYPLMKAIYPKGVITSHELAQSMFLAGVNHANMGILENEAIKQYLLASNK